MVDQAAVMDRMVRAAKIDVHLYEEVERDENATTQAALVVGIVAIASAIGAAIGAAMGGRSVIGALIVALLGALIGWVIWSYIAYFVGTRVFNGTATPGELLRTIGFAQTPGVLNILSFIPVLGVLISLVAALWALWAGVVAIRQALDFETGKAVGTVVIGWIVVFIINVLLLGPIMLALS